jgi:hypothetical protein
VNFFELIEKEAAKQFWQEFSQYTLENTPSFNFTLQHGGKNYT